MDEALAQALAGFALFLFPGLSWAFALSPGTRWPTAIPLGLVMAFTVAPSVLFVLNLFFGVPIRLSTVAFLSATVGMVGVAFAARRSLRITAGA